MKRTTMLGKHVHDERVRRGLTLEQLAEELDVSTHTIYRLEHGVTTGVVGKTSFAEKVTKWLGITPKQAWEEFRTEAEVEK